MCLYMNMLFLMILPIFKFYTNSSISLGVGGWGVGYMQIHPIVCTVHKANALKTFILN